MAETNRVTSTAAVNEEQRKIARDMDDVKQEEQTIAETPKQRRIAAMIEGAERTHDGAARHGTPRGAKR